MKTQTIFFNILSSFFLLWLCFATMWLCLSSQNFHYSFWYKKLSIEENIQRFAPLNEKGKQSFALTVPAQHAGIFSDVVHSINNAGKGLSDITYRPANAANSYIMFTPAEVTHLQDVADLLTLMKWVSLCVLVGFFVVMILMVSKKIALAKIKYHVTYGAGFIVVLTLLTLLLGPKNVFYWLHIHIFPEDHQWFFLYKESLMSTFMKAPDLFAPIAVSWLLSSVGLWLLILWVKSFKMV